MPPPRRRSARYSSRRPRPNSDDVIAAVIARRNRLALCVRSRPSGFRSARRALRLRSAERLIGLRFGRPPFDRRSTAGQPLTALPTRSPGPDCER